MVTFGQTHKSLGEERPDEITKGKTEGESN